MCAGWEAGDTVPQLREKPALRRKEMMKFTTKGFDEVPDERNRRVPAGKPAIQSRSCGRNLRYAGQLSLLANAFLDW